MPYFIGIWQTNRQKFISGDADQFRDVTEISDEELLEIVAERRTNNA
jgi:hypothetical protein